MKQKSICANIFIKLFKNFFLKAKITTRGEVDWFRSQNLCKISLVTFSTSKTSIKTTAQKFSAAFNFSTHTHKKKIKDQERDKSEEIESYVIEWRML